LEDLVPAWLTSFSGWRVIVTRSSYDCLLFLGRPAGLLDAAFSDVAFCFRFVACDMCRCETCALRNDVSREFVALANCTAAATALIPIAWYSPVRPELCRLVFLFLFGIAVHRFPIVAGACTSSTATHACHSIGKRLLQKEFRLRRDVPCVLTN